MESILSHLAFSSKSVDLFLKAADWCPFLVELSFMYSSFDNASPFWVVSRVSVVKGIKGSVHDEIGSMLYPRPLGTLLSLNGTDMMTHPCTQQIAILD